ncbi:MAG: hypothetical protein VR65_10825 [Desulfobulbaceae bacterium BRH_c16a]|nr:MAG: hypothetical protein VR65_10825 [Desulfobulbaceae bacterium BRH_c16a]
MGSKAYSLVGSVYFGLLDANKQLVGGYFKVGNVFPLKLKVETEQKSQISRQIENFGQTLDTLTRLKSITGNMDIHQWLAKTLAWGLSGGATAMTAEAGTVDAGTPEAIVAVHDQFVRLANKKVSSVVVKDEADTTTYDVGTDYTVNANLGMIEVLSTGTIADGSTLHVSYSYAAESGYRVDIGTNTLIRVAIMVDGQNEYTGEKIDAEFYSVVLASGSEIGIISEPESDYEKLPFAMTFETPEGMTSPGKINGIPL